MPWRLALAATACSALVLAGCGGGSDALDRDTAMQHSMNIVVDKVRDEGSDMYHHRIQLLGATPFARRGWLVLIADRTAGGTICVLDIPSKSAVGAVEDIGIVPCALHTVPAGPAATPPASA